MNKKCAILQPTFMPWIGFFDIIDQVDKLIFLDNVQFSKQSWQQKNKILLDGKEHQITIAVDSKGKSNQLINEVAISKSFSPNKLLLTIKHAYKKSKFYEWIFPEFEEIIELFLLGNNQLVELNTKLIIFFLTKLNITVDIILSSDLKKIGNRGEYVADLCSQINSNNYLSPAGSENYLKEDIIFFKNRKIKIFLHRYSHPIYKQIYNKSNINFIPYLSVIDLLFNHGPDSLNIIKSGRLNSYLLS